MNTPSKAVVLSICISVWSIGIAEAAPGVFRAGSAKVDITPKKWPVSLVGSFSDRLADKAFDRLHARALVLEEGRTRVAMVVVDNCLIPRAVLDEAKKRAAKISGIRIDRMLVSATHSHSAPASKTWAAIGIKADPDYLEQLQDGIAQAIHLAEKNLVPAEIGWGVADAPKHVFNRRWYVKPEAIGMDPFGKTNDIVKMNPPRKPDWLIKPAAPTDPEVSFITVRSKSGKPIALFANYSLHYVGGVPAGGVSADYYGEFARMMEKDLGRDEPGFVAIMSNGTSGDINNINFTNPWPRREPFEQIKIVARYVADAVLAEHSKVKFQEWVPVKMVQKELAVKTRRPTAEQVAQAKVFLAEPDDKKLPPRARAYANWTLMLAEQKVDKIIIQALRIGDLGIATLPCETFVEIGLDIKKRSPMKRTFTVELANGHSSYLPTPEQHKLGGYETWLGSCILEENASVKITNQLLSMLKQIAK